MITPGVITDGKFSVSLGAPKVELRKIEGQPSGITMSNPNAKAYVIAPTGWGLTLANQSTASLAHMGGATITVVYYYFDTDTTMTGSDEVAGPSGTINASANCAFKAGWNTVIVEQNANTQSMKTGVPTSDHKWTYSGPSS